MAKSERIRAFGGRGPDSDAPLTDDDIADQAIFAEIERQGRGESEAADDGESPTRSSRLRSR